jgi:hypothetical protein
MKNIKNNMFAFVCSRYLVGIRNDHLRVLDSHLYNSLIGMFRGYSFLFDPSEIVLYTDKKQRRMK